MTANPRESGDNRRRRIGRRSVLTAGAGVVAGAAAGGGLGSALASAPAASPGSHLPPPGEALMTEHGVLRRLLLAYRAIGERLDTGGRVDAGVLADAVQIMADYVEGFHEGLEEAYVFPRVAREQPHLIRTLLVQHDRGRHLTAALSAAAATLDSGETRRAVAGHLAAFVRMYEPHEAWEDTVVYPALRRLTSQQTLALLAERFAELENKQYGDDALGKLLDRVAGIEERLSIHDLAAFTPAPL